MSLLKTKRSVDTTLVTTSDEDIELSETIEKIQLYSVINELLIIVNTLVKVTEPNIENSSLLSIFSNLSLRVTVLLIHINRSTYWLFYFIQGESNNNRKITRAGIVRKI